MLKSLHEFKRRQDKLTEEKILGIAERTNIFDPERDVTGEVGCHLEEREPCMPLLLLSSSPGIQHGPPLRPGL